MVNPAEAFAQTLGLPSPAGAGAAAKGQIGRLFTLALFRAGRDGCACPPCRHLIEIVDLMIEGADAPFPAESQPPAAPAGPTPPAAPARAAPERSWPPPVHPRVTAEELPASHA
ncbi:MAG: hypothetical protein ACREEO_00740 [Phenylobacterium sp.]